LEAYDEIKEFIEILYNYSYSGILLLASKNPIFDILKIHYGIKIIKMYSYNPFKA
jgi:hypothetical protein